MEDDRDEIAWLARMADGDATAMAALYDRHSRVVFSLALRILRDRSEAEDVVQEVFVRAWTRARTYDASLGSPAAWLVRIARNRAIDRLRHGQVRSRTAEAAPQAEIAPDNPEHAATLTERQQAVARALGALPPPQRTLIERAYFGGLTQAELAEHFQLPLGTVKTRIRTGMMALRRALQHVHATAADDRTYGRP